MKKQPPKQLTPWKPGESGNPNGRPPGARNKITLAVENLLDGEAEKLTRKAVELALAGDVTALRLCMDRILPARKDRHVPFTMPCLESAADATQAIAAVTAAVAAGELTPMEAAELSKVVDCYTRSLEATDFESRLTKLENGRSP